uniref:HNH domain-containing protein n=1 Tax=uncultured organism TaxID=155900 RepID=A0A7L9QCE6_9ZZZZ|nr:hypothetical protein [uncultured organism]
MPGHSRANPNYGPRPTRGNSYDRRRRKQWLLDTYGDGFRVKCYRFEVCKRYLTWHTLTVDRIQPGCEGGTYQRGNIRPACATCNSSTGGILGNERKAAKHGTDLRV